MSTHFRTNDVRRFGRVPQAACMLALGASLSLLACEQTDRGEAPGKNAEPTPTRIGEPGGTPETDEDPANAEPMKTQPSPIDAQGGTEQERQDQPGSMGGQAMMGGERSGQGGSAMGGQAGQMHGQMHGQMQGQQGSMTEKTASGDLQSFERRFEDALGQQDLTLAASFDVPEQEQMRMFVVAQKEPSGGQAAQQGGAGSPGAAAPGSQPGTRPQPSDEMGAGTPPPAAGGSTTASAGTGREGAQSALETTRLVVAYSDEAMPDRVTIAYMQPKGAPTTGTDSPDAKLFAAIDRAASDQEGSTPPTGEEQPTPPEPGTDERQG